MTFIIINNMYFCVTGIPCEMQKMESNKTCLSSRHFQLFSEEPVLARSTTNSWAFWLDFFVSHYYFQSKLCAKITTNVHGTKIL